MRFNERITKARKALTKGPEYKKTKSTRLKPEYRTQDSEKEERRWRTHR